MLIAKRLCNYGKFLRHLQEDVFFLSAYAHHIMQVIARWNPSGARRPVLEEAPVFYPSEEVSYIYHTMQ